MKKILSPCFLLLPFLIFGQQKLITRNASIHFISHTDIIDIEGNTQQAGSIIDLSTGEIIFAVPMKSFQFKLALAEDHFNEDYVESEKYPKATFSGIIKNIIDFHLDESKPFDAEIEGILTLHGQDKTIKTNATIEKSKEKWIGRCTFSILLSDYNIQVPNLVKDKVAPIIPISISADYKLLHK